jgi:hypothetical protein
MGVGALGSAVSAATSGSSCTVIQLLGETRDTMPNAWAMLGRQTRRVLPSTATLIGGEQ